MTQPVEQLRRDLLGLGSSYATITTYCSMSGQYLKHSEGVLSDRTALDFMATLREKEAKASTRHTVYYALRKLFGSQGIPFTVPPPKASDQSETDRPVLSREEVLSLIEWAKTEASPKHAAYLVLSTIYGIRRIELRELREESLVDNHLLVWTKKKGRPANHLIPDEVSPYLYNFRDWGKLSDTAASMLFKEILIKSGNGLRKGFGWHSIRRALATELRRNHVDALTIYQFMRWSTGRTPMAMVALYTGSFEDEDVDKVVFENHPFLEAWRDE